MEKLITEILEYMDDSSARYAIALEGDWGSGKTSFCINRLDIALRKKGYTMNRVSLFGVSSPSDVYSLLAASMIQTNLHPDELKNKKSKRVGKELRHELFSSLKETVTNVLEKMGFSVAFSPQLLTSVLGQKNLIVFDDVERHKFSDSIDFFGLANNLVENQNCKVMFVTSKLSDIQEDIREKLIWRILRYEPRAEYLIQSVFKEAEYAPSIRINVARCLTNAANRTNCKNARAMIKSRRLIILALQCPVFFDSSYDSYNLESAFTDFVEFSLLSASNNPPAFEDLVGIDDSISIEYMEKKYRLEKYLQLNIIHDTLHAGKFTSIDILEKRIRQYVNTHYHQSSNTMMMIRMIDTVPQINDMDEIKLTIFSRNYYHAFLYCDFDIGYMPQALINAYYLLPIIADSVSLPYTFLIDCLNRRAKRLLGKSDLYEVLSFIDSHMAFMPNDATEELKNLIRDVYNYSLLRHDEILANVVNTGVECNPQSLQKIVGVELSRGTNIYNLLSYNNIAEHYFSSSIEYQDSVLSFIEFLKNDCPSDYYYILEEWLISFESAVDKYDVKTVFMQNRKRLLRQSIEKGIEKCVFYRSW